jgi:hypothetical protein
VKVVLDSSILCADFRLEGGPFETFFQGLTRIGARCYLPETVLDEVIAGQRRQLDEIEQKVERLQGKWMQLAGCPLPLVPAATSQTRPDYAGYLRAQLKEREVEILPYPDVPHKTLVARALARCRPFKESGGGYRDALIWHSTLALIEGDADHVCLVTANTKDFGIAPALHPDLQKDVRSGVVVELFNTLEQFNAAKVVPVLERLGDLMHRLEEGTFSPFSLDRWIDENIIKAINENEDVRHFVPLEYGHGRVWASELMGIESTVIDDVRLLPSGDILLMANADIRIEVVVSAGWEDCERHRDVREFFGGDCSGDSSIRAEEEGNVAFTLTLKKDTFQATWCDIDALETSSGSVEINPHERREVEAGEASQQT